MAKANKSYAPDKRDIISLLEIELGLVEDGGYGRSPRAPRIPKPMFQHSVSCINHWIDPDHPVDTCEGCVLLDFVPEEHKHREMPCHFILLNEAGETVDSLEQVGDRERLEEVVANWLRSTLRRLKAELESEQSRTPDV